jgi:starch-binding outer membrane protein SusE/F
MKRYINALLLSLSLIFVFSCSESYTELNKGETALALSLDNTDVTLDLLNPTTTAMTFTWTSGTNKGTNCSISYVFQIDLAGNDFADPATFELGKDIYTLEYTNEAMNELLRDSFNIVDGASANLEARIIALPANESVDDQTSEAVSLKVTTYKPVSSTVYLYGSATPGGLTLADATKMNSVTGEAGGFVWTGDLNPGTFKLLTTNTSELPSYNRDASSSDKLVYREADTDVDNLFTIATSGTYKVTVNIIDLTITVEATSGPKYSKIYFVGSFTSWGFVEMRQDPINNYIFRYGAVLEWNDGGEFKFGTQNGSWSNMYHPTIASAPYTHTAVTQDETNDNKWLIPEADCGKAYKIALDITDGAESMKMSVFTPYETLYIVGDATPNGWTIASATPMTKVDDYNFTWTGALTAGSMKITCDKQGDWAGAWFMSASADETPTGSEQYMTFVDKINDSSQADVDRQWKITGAGTYTITGNQLTETITIAKQ